MSCPRRIGSEVIVVVAAIVGEVDCVATVPFFGGEPRLEPCQVVALFARRWREKFGGADYLTGLHDFRFRLPLGFELGMPLVPAMVVFLGSLHDRTICG